ncbi:MAG: F0F1 ATP synthase subunit delta [Micromonosporaceae bacterium]
MQAASRESYTAVRERFDEQARTAEPADLVTTADELLSVAGLLQRQPRLRRALSDPSRAGEDRAELVRSLLGDRVSAPVVELVAGLVAGRWSSSVDLLGAVEQLGVEALLASSDRAGTLGEVEDELFRFGHVVDGDQRLGGAVADQSATVARRTELVRGLLDGKADPVTVRLTELSVSGFGGRNFSASLARLVELAAERRERRVAYVTVAAPLADADEERLSANLSRIYGEQVSLKVTVDPSVIGGISVQIGHDLYDGTVLRRLNQVRGALVGRK